MSDHKMPRNQLEKVFKALANRRRLYILARIQHSGEINVGGLAREMGLSIKATSRHLVILEKAGLLEKEQRRHCVFYKLADRPTLLIHAVLAEL